MDLLPEASSSVHFLYEDLPDFSLIAPSNLEVAFPPLPPMFMHSK